MTRNEFDSDDKPELRAVRLYFVTMTSQPVFWLRCETKEFERRSALTPSTAKQLINDGFKIYVERDHQRIFDDEEFEKYGYITSQC